MAAKALRNIDKLAGKSFKSGDEIPDAVIAKISPQVLRALVEARTLEVPGMEAAAGGTGGLAHIMARLDKQDDQLKKQAAVMNAQADKIEALEAALKADGKTIAAPAKAEKKKTNAKAETVKA